MDRITHTQKIGHSRTDKKALAQIYQKPQRVNQACSFSRVNTNSDFLVDHNCPLERGASGSIYATNIEGKNYILGISTRASLNNIESSIRTGGSTMLTSSSFCADYQTACGQPCPKFKDVVPAP